MHVALQNVVFEDYRGHWLATLFEHTYLADLLAIKGVSIGGHVSQVLVANAEPFALVGRHYLEATRHNARDDARIRQN